LKALQNVKVMAEKIAQFIESYQIDPKNVHCIGHSLGAQVIFNKTKNDYK
jgi:pimeloyl-ACP methyl ester carboxylesterase